MIIDVALLTQWVSSVVVIGGFALGVYRVIKRYLFSQHEACHTRVMAELAIINDGLLACLNGLEQQGCNGEVTRAKNKLKEHLNEQAHK